MRSFDDHELAALLKLLPPAPDHVVQAVRELPSLVTPETSDSDDTEVAHDNHDDVPGASHGTDSGLDDDADADGLDSWLDDD